MQFLLSFSIMMFIFFNPAAGAQTESLCEFRFQALEGHSLRIAYQLRKIDSSSSKLIIDPLWLQLDSAIPSDMKHVQMELTDQNQSRAEAHRQTLLLKLYPLQSGNRFRVKTQILTSQDSRQFLKVQVGQRWLQNKQNAQNVFSFQLGRALEQAGLGCIKPSASDALTGR